MTRHLPLVLALCLLPGLALGAPRVEADSARKARAARETLVKTVRDLRRRPTRARLDAAQAAMRALEAAADAYFHGENLRAPGARPHVLALRHEIHLALGGEDPVLTLHDDVLHFRPAIHRTLADASRVLGERETEIRHLRIAIALSGPDSKRLGALRAAYLALGNRRGAEAVSQRLARLDSGELEQK